MSRARGWNSGVHPRYPDGRFRPKHGGGSPTRGPRKKRTRAQQVERNRKVVKGLVIGAYAGAGAFQAREAYPVIAGGIASGNPGLVAVGGARIATSVARQANEIHHVHKMTLPKGRKMTRAQENAHVKGYLQREKVIGRAHTATGYAVIGTTVYQAHKMVKNAGGYTLAADRIRARRAGAARASSRGLPKQGYKVKPVRPNRKGVYTVTTMGKRVKR